MINFNETNVHIFINHIFFYFIFVLSGPLVAGLQDANHQHNSTYKQMDLHTSALEKICYFISIVQRKLRYVEVHVII